MLSYLRNVTAGAIAMLLMVTIWSTAGRSHDRGRAADDSSRPASESKPQESSVAPTRMGTEEKLVRDVYARLMRYQSAAIDEAIAQRGQASQPDDYLTFELRSIRSGKIAEILDQPLANLISPQGDATISLKQVHLGEKDSPHAYYGAVWAAASASKEQSAALVKDLPGVADLDGYTSYVVRVHFQGRQATYRAMVAYRLQESGKPADVQIFDNVTVDMNTVYADQSPRVRSPWQKYSKTSLYQAVTRTIQETRESGRPLIPPDAPIGYLPGDDASPNEKDAVMLATLVECSALSVHMSAAQTIKDGETASFNVTTSGATPTAYAWSFTAPSGSGNNPNVNFTNGTTDSVTTDGHWFANPNQECSASYDAVYTIKCTVTFDNSKTKSAQTTLTVNAFWNPAGTTAPPPITGGVTTDFDSTRNLYYVANSGTANRGSPVVNIIVPSSSQFYTKASDHEARHAYQWTTGMNVDLFQIADLMTHLSPLTDPTRQGLQTKIDNEFIAWFNAQSQITANRKSAAEKDAYDVSDLVAPKYLYQNCGRFH